jgi:hypothetical protein
VGQLEALVNWFKRHIFGFRSEDTFPLSNERRFAGRVSLLLCIFLIFQFSFSPLDTGFVLLLIGWVCSIWSLGYFLYVVLLIGFYVANTKAQRLFLDSLISAGLMVFSSALLFQSYGIIGPNSDPILNRDVVYFAAVTFSTLGFGDFRPSPDARLIAASVAILGNLHLAVLVGAVFRSMR